MTWIFVSLITLLCSSIVSSRKSFIWNLHECCAPRFRDNLIFLNSSLNQKKIPYLASSSKSPASYRGKSELSPAPSRGLSGQPCLENFQRKLGPRLSDALADQPGAICWFWKSLKLLGPLNNRVPFNSLLALPPQRERERDDGRGSGNESKTLVPCTCTSPQSSLTSISVTSQLCKVSLAIVIQDGRKQGPLSGTRRESNNYGS